jgi:hypothetical protein
MEATSTWEPAAAPQANPTHLSDFDTRLEEARAAGPSSWLHSQLLELRDLARAAGVEQHAFRAALVAHALACCRPDPEERRIFAYMLAKQARELDSAAFAEAVEAGRWEL